MSNDPKTENMNNQKPSTNSKLEKLQVRLEKLLLSQKKVNDSVKKISTQIELVKQAEQSKLVKKLTDTPEALKTLLDNKLISQEDYELFNKSK